MGAVTDTLLILSGIQFILLGHELAHAAVGRVAGIRSIEIIIGVGKPLLRWRNLTWCALPIGGRCRFDADTHNTLARYQKILIALAGPAANLWIAKLLMLAQGPDILVRISLILGVINLIPLPRTDGWQALSQLLNKPQMASFALNPWLVEGLLAFFAVLIFA